MDSIDSISFFFLLLPTDDLVTCTTLRTEIFTAGQFDNLTVVLWQFSPAWLAGWPVSEQRAMAQVNLAAICVSETVQHFVLWWLSLRLQIREQSSGRGKKGTAERRNRWSSCNLGLENMSPYFRAALWAPDCCFSVFSCINNHNCWSIADMYLRFIMRFPESWVRVWNGAGMSLITETLKHWERTGSHTAPSCWADHHFRHHNLLFLLLLNQRLPVRWTGGAVALEAVQRQSAQEANM